MFEIVQNNLDPIAAQRNFLARCGPNIGAVVSFLGLVRGKPGDTLTLSHYPQMAEAFIAELVAQAQARFEIDHIYIGHRIGTMAVGDTIVLVLTAAAHRRNAFEAADFVMDHLKSRAPFFKQACIDGQSNWIEPRLADFHDLARWQPL